MEDEARFRKEKMTGDGHDEELPETEADLADAPKPKTEEK